jgi:hypothetical protein
MPKIIDLRQCHYKALDALQLKTLFLQQIT